MVCKVLQPPSIVGILRSENPTALYLKAWFKSIIAYFLTPKIFLGE